MGALADTQCMHKNEQGKQQLKQNRKVCRILEKNERQDDDEAICGQAAVAIVESVKNKKQKLQLTCVR